MLTTLDYTQSYLYDYFAEGCVDTQPIICRNVRIFLRHEADMNARENEPNFHDKAILFICLSGRGRLLYGRDICEISEEEGLLVMPRQPHMRLPLEDQKVEYLVIRFEPNDNPIFSSLAGRILHLSPNARHALDTFISDYQKAEKTHSPKDANNCLFSLGLFFNCLRPSETKPLATTELSPRIEKACKALFAQDGYAPTLQEIAANLGITANHLRACFKKSMGRSPKQLRNLQLKMTAEQLLTNTTLPISEIAEQLHFNSIYSFSRFFRKNCNCSPSEFRKNH